MVFWSGVVGPGTSFRSLARSRFALGARTIALRAQKLDLWASLCEHLSGLQLPALSEGANQKFVGPGLQVYGLATPLESVKVFLPRSQYPADFTRVSFQSELWTTVLLDR